MQTSVSTRILDKWLTPRRVFVPLLAILLGYFLVWTPLFSVVQSMRPVVHIESADDLAIRLDSYSSLYRNFTLGDDVRGLAPAYTYDVNRSSFRWFAGLTQPVPVKGRPTCMLFRLSNAAADDEQPLPPRVTIQPRPWFNLKGRCAEDQIVAATCGDGGIRHVPRYVIRDEPNTDTTPNLVLVGLTMFIVGVEWRRQERRRSRAQRGATRDT